jgi:dipeptidyl aminopeptidase/acylaminoacyl peptidase
VAPAVRRRTAAVVAALAAIGCVPLATGTPGAVGGRDTALPLAFGGNGDIFSLSVDGRARRQLTRVPPGGLARDPAWSPEGARIAFAYAPPPSSTRGPDGLLPQPVGDVYVMGAGGEGVRVLVRHDAPGVSFETPVWGPPGPGSGLYATRTARLVAGGVFQDVDVSIVHLDLDGGAPRTIVPDALAPALSPDGQRLAYVTAQGASRSLVVGDADGQGQRTLVPAGQFDQLDAPRFSPDGQLILFSAAPPIDGSAVVTPGPPALDGRDSTLRLPDAPAPPSPPRVAPGSAWRSFSMRNLASRVASLAGALGPQVAQAHGVSMDLFVVPAEGGPVRRLTRVGADSPSAAWSPDGRRVACCSGFGVYVLNADGSGLVSIDRDGGHGAIDWSRA